MAGRSVNVANKRDSLFKKNSALWLVILFVTVAAIGGWLVKFGIDRKNDNAHLREICTEQTTGTVTGFYETGEYRVDYNREENKDEVHDTRKAFPIYEYQAGGRTYTVQSERYDSEGKHRYKKDEKIAVFYAPGDPETHYLPGETGDADLTVRLCIGFGGFLLLLGVFAIFKLFIFRKKPKKNVRRFE